LTQNHHLRLIKAENTQSLHQQLALLGVSASGCYHMVPKGQFFLLYVDDLSNPAVLILKQEMLSLGAEAAIHHQVIVNGIDKSAVLLMATLAQYHKLIEKLQTQGFGLSQLADEIVELLSRIQCAPKAIVCHNRDREFVLDFRKNTLLMGIANLTPDSFYDGGKYNEPNQAIDHIFALAEAGADIIDIGGASSRPGFSCVEPQEEIDRILPVVEAVAPLLSVPISIDSDKAQVMDLALAAGAMIVNDIGGLQKDPEMAKVAVKYNAPVIIMHDTAVADANPVNLKKNQGYDMVDCVLDFFRNSIEVARKAGVEAERLIVDPGIGFGKTLEENLLLLRRLPELAVLGHPVLVGTSNKSFIGKLLGLPIEARSYGTAASVALAIAGGAQIVRVHGIDVMLQAAVIADAILGRHDHYE